MLRTILRVLGVWTGVSVFVAGCGGSRGDLAVAPPPVVVSAGVTVLSPAYDAPDSIAGGVDLQTMLPGLFEPSPDSQIRGFDFRDADIYEVTTPAGEPFCIHFSSRSAGNTGWVRIMAVHIANGSTKVNGAPTSFAEAGFVPVGTGISVDSDLIEAWGDGFSRLTLTGAIEEDQLIAIRAGAGKAWSSALVHLRIGPTSEINASGGTVGDDPSIVDSKTLYSSDSWRFALPTIAISGDRASIVTYEGDKLDPQRLDRYEMRVQYSSASGKVTGGASEEVGLDTGNWRDHEVAALYNVLAMVQSGTESVSIRLSFDRGATIGQSEVLAVNGEFRQRLVQVAMALDYTLAVTYWSSHGSSTRLLLVEGRPSDFDGTGSPTRYEFDAARVIHDARSDVVPLLMGAAYSEGGDLVLGYGWTRFIGLGNSQTQYRCAVRPYHSTFVDRLVEEDGVWGMDPSVSLLGEGKNLEIYYAYETRDGIRLRASYDGGATFSAPQIFGDPLANTPSVFARRHDGGRTSVDVLYLAFGQWGTELHVRRWTDYSTIASAKTYRLTKSRGIRSADLPTDTPTPGTGSVYALPFGMRITQVSWFGYDAVLDKNEIVAVYNEQTYDAYTICSQGGNYGMVFDPEPAPPGASFSPIYFEEAEPPPLAPGLTEPVAAPDANHMNQLKLVRLE